MKKSALGIGTGQHRKGDLPLGTIKGRTTINNVYENSNRDFIKDIFSDVLP